MKNAKRILCLLLALCLCAGLLAGCNSSSGRQPAELHVYDSTDVDTGIGDMVDGFGELTIAGDRLYTVGYKYDEEYNETSYLLSVKLDGSDVQSTPVKFRDYDPANSWSNIQTLLADDAGTLYAVECFSSSSGDGEDWVYSEQFFIHRLTADYTIESSIELEIPEGVWPDTYASIWAGDGFLIPVDGKILHVTLDGKSRTIDALNGDNGYINRMYRNADGSILLYYYGGENWTAHFAPLDLVTGKLGEEIPMPAGMDNGNLISDANGKLYNYDMTGIYAIDFEAGTTELLCSWLDSDIDYNTITDLQPQTDGSFLAVSRGDNWDKLILSKLTYVDPATLPEKTVLTLACTYSWEMQRAALAFNRASDTVRITLKDYSKYNTEENEWTGAVTQMNSDIITGNIPDLLLVDSTLPFQNYVAKGLFTDLYPLLDADPAFSREDLVASVLKACETNGQLTSIIPTYGIMTLVGPAATVGEKPGWTWDEFFAVLDKYPNANPAMAYMDRENLLTLALIMNNRDFIDQDTGTCHFDSDAFVSLLEYAATYPEEYDYDSMTSSEKDMFANGELLLSQAWLSEFSYMRDYVYNMNGPVTFKGFPSSDGVSGSAISPNMQLAISEACPDKEAAWEFVRYFLSDEYQLEGDQAMWSLSIRNDVLQKKAEDALHPEENNDYIVDMMPAVGATMDIAVEDIAVEEAVVEENTADSDSAEDEILTDDGIADDDIAEVLPEDGWTDEENYWNRPLTQAEVDQIMELINSTTTLYQYDEALMDIVLEEANAFFAGTRSAKDAAAILQNRAQTYISESR